MFADVSLVVIVGPGDVSELPAWLRNLAHHVHTSRTAVVVAYAPEVALDVAEACHGHPDVLSLALPGVGDAAAAVAELAATVPTPHFAITTPAQTASQLAGIATDLTAERPTAATVTSSASPLLLWHPSTPVELVTAFIDQVLGAQEQAAPDLSDYLGYLALRTARLSVQWLDPRDGDVDIALRLNLAGHCFSRRPPWQFSRDAHRHHRTGCPLTPGRAGRTRRRDGHVPVGMARGTDAVERRPSRRLPDRARPRDAARAAATVTHGPAQQRVTDELAHGARGGPLR